MTLSLIHILQEIAMNILDIAYNSIKAQANLIKIIIHDSSKLNIINIQIIDNGIGMDKTTVKNVIDPFYTTCLLYTSRCV